MAVGDDKSVKKEARLAKPTTIKTTIQGSCGRESRRVGTVSRSGALTVVMYFFPSYQ